MAFGDTIRNAREKLRLTQHDLARAVEVHHTYIAHIESGARSCAQDLIPRFAEALDLGIDALRAGWQRDREKDQQAKAQPATPYLSLEQIESVASRDRAHFLELIQRERISFPRDRPSLVRTLCEMELVFDEYIEGAEGAGKRGAFAATFRSYRGMEPALVVATLNVKTGKPVSEQTKTFQMLHEVGHCRLHWLSAHEQMSGLALPHEPVFCSAGDRAPKERQANVYASAFLMPASSVRSVLGDRRTLDMDAFMKGRGRELCDLFFVEPQMLRYRIGTLGVRVYSRSVDN